MEIIEKLFYARDWVFERFGLKTNKEETILEDVEEKTEIPQEYAQRFTLDPLFEKSQLVARDDTLELFEKAYENWKINNNPLLVVAEPGEGMSSLLNANSMIYPVSFILENGTNFHSRKELIQTLANLIGYPEVTGFDELAEKVDDSEESIVFVFENIERLFLRRINGFNLLEDFLVFIRNTRTKIYWLCTINKYSLYYLDQTINFSTNFLSIIRLKQFTLEQLQEVIEMRNKGYELIFLKPDSLSKAQNRKLNKIDKVGKQDALKEQFYKNMLQFSDGNVSAALLFYKHSIVRIKEKRVYVKAYNPKEIAPLTLDELFILEAIMEHGSLSTTELKLVLRNSSKGSRLALEYLMEKNLLYPKYYKNDAEVEYQINLLHMKALKLEIHSRLNRNF